jgi:sugar phosphate isomerase/epimerase
LTTADGLAKGKQAADLCTALGLTLLNTAIGGHYKEGEDKSAFMSHIGDLADYCEERGITIGLEVHGEIMATGTASISVIEEIGRENVKINYDTANCELYGATKAVDELRAVVPYLCHIHLKDKAGAQDEWNFPAVGEGHVNFERIARILRDEGYDKPYSVEIEFTGEPWPPIEEVHRAMATSYETLQRVNLP